MSRPVKNRHIACVPAASYFKPVGIPLRELEEIVLGMDELEAMRLADLEGLYQVDAAEKMGVSRQTIGNILNSAHRKLADALLNGKALRIGPHLAGEAITDCLPKVGINKDIS
ncbi:MAG: DUF134 domain-containing protein [Betaproteobacteria bacterium]